MPYRHGVLVNAEENIESFMMEQQMDEKEKQTEYLKSMIDSRYREMLRFVEELLDRLEKEGSTLYDEYPDKVRVELLTQILVEKYMRQNGDTMQMPEEQVFKIMKTMLIMEMIARRNCQGGDLQ